MSGSNVFCFKRFVVEQKGCAMKVGTDGVLLGAWCRIDPEHDKVILDIGTGTGVIALQLAQRTESIGATIEAIEIDPGACEAARRNFEVSEWADRLALHSMSVQEFSVAAMTSQKQLLSLGMRATVDGLFDHIVSNPPWFVDSLTSQDASRNLARHSHSLNYDDLMKCCFRLLKPDGHLSLVVPAGVETEKMIAAARTRDFAVSRLTEVYSTPKNGPKRTLLEFMRKDRIPDGRPGESNILVVEGSGSGTFSAEYQALTRDFYLYF